MMYTWPKKEDLVVKCDEGQKEKALIKARDFLREEFPVAFGVLKFSGQYLLKRGWNQIGFFPLKSLRFEEAGNKIELVRAEVLLEQGLVFWDDEIKYVYMRVESGFPEGQVPVVFGEMLKAQAVKGINGEQGDLVYYKGLSKIYLRNLESNRKFTLGDAKIS